MTTNGTWFRLSPIITSNPRLSSNMWANSFRHKQPNRCYSSGSGFFPEKNKKIIFEAKQELKPLWDDGYGTQTVKHYLEAAKDMIKSDGGPPRWFCPVESGPPLKNSPVLLYLPGIDGVGLGLILHHKALGKVYEVRCMHIPVYDRTPYEKLVNFVENAVRDQHSLFPNKPIYIVGDSFGACLALSVAASNPTIDLVLILVNSATSFNKSKIRPLLPFLEFFPENLHTILPYIIGVTLGDPIKMANVINAKNPLTSPVKQIEKLMHELSSLITGVSSLSDILPKQTLIWKVKLLESASSSSNSLLGCIKHEVLILASGKDNILPSKNEAQRLSELLKNSKVRIFLNNGHALLLEDEINLLTVLKATDTYRRSKRHDPITDFLPPSESEFQKAFDHFLGLFRVGISPAMFSTLDDGKIVRGLKGVPDEGPVLLVGYHMMIGVEVTSFAEEFLREKSVVIRGMAHPEVFTKDFETSTQEISGFDYFRVFGATPATPTNFFKLLKNKSHVVLYPGGVREALHRRGDEYKLCWPDESEFVRVAARFGAKIVPFGVVGEDDLFKIFLDYDDLLRIPLVNEMIRHDLLRLPLVNEMIRRRNENMERMRVGSETNSKVAKLNFSVPFIHPKVPGRFYFLFGKPVETEGREELVKDRFEADELYNKLKCEVKQCLAYLIEKREEDPYRHLVDRLLYQAVLAPVHQIPAFDP